MREFWDNWLDFWDDNAGTIILVSLLFAGLAVCEAVDLNEQAKWEAFAASHNCVVIGHREGQFAYRSYISGLTGFKCDDGMEYWR